MKTIFTNGCFDILHRGHFELLKYARDLGDRLIVAINTDSSVKRLKGENRPFFNQDDRKFMLECCKFVDEVVFFNEETPLEIIKFLKPDVIVKGGDYKVEDVVGHKLAEVKIFNFVDGYSTTKVLEGRSE
jgi:D-beta-D-heptose 7-phosphate kinase/D-beta-D-heptose 1-phosphate adenosyltransferase